MFTIENLTGYNLHMPGRNSLVIPAAKGVQTPVSQELVKEHAKSLAKCIRKAKQLVLRANGQPAGADQLLQWAGLDADGNRKKEA